MGYVDDVGQKGPGAVLVDRDAGRSHGRGS